MYRNELIENILYDFAAIGRTLTLVQRNWPVHFSDPQRQILTMLLRHKGGLPIKRLAAFSGVTSSAVTQQVETLEKSGMVNRTSSQNDKRSVMVTLSDQALSIIGDEVLPHLTSVLDKQYFSVLTVKELATFKRLHAKLAGRVEPI